MQKNISILFVAAECSPFFKIGGLADVVGSLPYALKKQGVDVRIMLPKYGVLDTKKHKLRRTKHRFQVEAGGKTHEVLVWETTLPNSKIPVYFLEQDTFFSQGNVYLQKLTAPASDIKRLRRFAFFTRAATHALQKIAWQPNVVHVHDWHMGLLPFELQKLAKSTSNYRQTKTVLTIHNVGYQGHYHMRDVVNFLGLSLAEQKEIRQKVLKKGEMRFLNIAAEYSDRITTVSPMHAHEIQTAAYGYDLEKLLRKKRVAGILNGIPTNVFDPHKDADIVRRYNAVTFVRGKKINKQSLQAEMNLVSDVQAPLLGVIGRLAYQKGIELLLENIEWLVRRGVQIVVLGSGAKKYERQLLDLRKKYKGYVAVHIGFSAALARGIYAGSDMFLMPSRYEPCGLGQMIAMRYGSVPIARKTGGLADTIRSHPNSRANGFLFTMPTAASFKRSLSQALKVYDEQPKAWQKIIRNGMTGDYSWNRSAKEYMKLYKALMKE